MPFIPPPALVQGPRTLKHTFLDETQERKSSFQSKFWSRTSRGRPSGYPGGRPGAKTSVRPSKSWKNKLSVRTSMTRRRNVHGPRAGLKKLRSENLRAEFLFPIYPCQTPGNPGKEGENTQKNKEIFAGNKKRKNKERKIEKVNRLKFSISLENFNLD